MIRKKVAHSLNNPTANRTEKIELLLINTSVLCVFSRDANTESSLRWFSQVELKMLWFKESIVVEDIKSRKTDFGHLRLPQANSTHETENDNKGED